MKKLAICFGAGKTGRGFAAHLSFLSGYQVVLVDKNEKLVDALTREGKYFIQVLGNAQMDCTVLPTGVFTLKDKSWLDYLVNADLVFTSVFGNNLKELSESLATAFVRRYNQNPDKSFNIITCENYTHAASFLKDCVFEKIPDKNQYAWASEIVGFSGSMILRTCLNASENQHPLTIRAQDFFELPCDGEAFKGGIPELFGIKPLNNFENQLRRKIYTYNCINAVITFLGAEKGYTQLSEAANDPEIIDVARRAARETSEAQISEFEFDANEQAEWVEAAFAKFSDTNLPDPIGRNGADPVRKLSREDRLIGPALLALKHGIQPDGLLSGIIAGLKFYDRTNNIRLSDLIAKDGINAILEKVCQLNPNETLFKLIKETYQKSDH